MAADTDFDDDAFGDSGFNGGGSGGGSASGGSVAVKEKDKDKDDGADARTVAGRQKIREKLAKDVEAFLAKGGQIKEIDANTTADPPVRPSSEYGSRPI